MANRDAYLFYEAGQAVAAAHLGLTIRHISGDPAQLASDIVLPRNTPKARMILWLTGMAAEKKGVGKSDPLRRTRNRLRMRSQIESVIIEMKGSRSRRLAEAKLLVNQAQDRANAICTGLYDAITEIVELLRTRPSIAGQEVYAVVQRFKQRRRGEGKAEGDMGLPPPEPSS